MTRLLLAAFTIAAVVLLSVVMWRHHAEVMAAMGLVLVACVAVAVWMGRGS